MEEKIQLWVSITLTVLLLAATIALGVYTGSFWIGLTIFVGTFVVYWGGSVGAQGSVWGFYLGALGGLGLVGSGLWMGHFAGRWLWTLESLLLSLPLLVAGASQFKREEFFNGVVAYLLAITCLAFALFGPSLLYRPILLASGGDSSAAAVSPAAPVENSVPEEQPAAVPAQVGGGVESAATGWWRWWYLWLALGITSSLLACWQGLEWNPGRFLLFTLATLGLLALASLQSQWLGRWWWALPWGIACVAIGYGALDLHGWRETPAIVGVLAAVLALVVAVAGPLYFYGRAAPLPSQPVAAAPTTAPTAAPTVIPTAAPEAPAATMPLTAAANPWAYIWQTLVAGVLGVWGVFHLLSLGMLGDLWWKRWGAGVAWLGFLAGTYWIGRSSPELQSQWQTWFSASPVAWMRSVIDASLSAWGTPGYGLLLASMVVAVLLLPATRVSLLSNVPLQQAAALREIFDSDDQMRFLERRGVSAYRLMASYLANLVVTIGLVVSLWIALRQVASATPTALGFLFVPDMAQPHWRPVWQWGYFALGAIAWVALALSLQIQSRYMNLKTEAVTGLTILYVIGAIISALLIPSGVLLFALAQNLGQGLLTPLAAWQPGKAPARRPAPQRAAPRPAPRPAPKPAQPGRGVFDARPTPRPTPTPTPARPAPPQPVRPVIPTPAPALTLWDQFTKAGSALNGFALRAGSQGKIEAFILLENGRMEFHREGRRLSTSAILAQKPLGLVVAEQNAVAIDQSGELTIQCLEEDTFTMPHKAALSHSAGSFTLNPRGSMIACADPESGRVSGMFLSELRERLFIEGLPGPRALAFSSEGRYLAVACDDWQVHVIDIATRQEARVLDLQSSGMTREPVLFLSAGIYDGSPSWVAATRSELVQWSSDGKLLDHTRLKSTPTCLAVHPRLGDIAVGSSRGKVRLYSAALRLLEDENAHESSVLQLAYAPGNGILISAGRDDTLRTFNP